MSQTSLTRSTLNRSSLRPGFLASPRHIPSALDFELEVKGQYKVMAIKTPRDQLTGSFLNQEDTHVKVNKKYLFWHRSIHFINNVRTWSSLAEFVNHVFAL